jgi:hypothetical protein
MNNTVHNKRFNSTTNLDNKTDLNKNKNMFNKTLPIDFT